MNTNDQTSFEGHCHVHTIVSVSYVQQMNARKSDNYCNLFILLFDGDITFSVIFMRLQRLIYVFCRLLVFRNTVMYLQSE